jgi:hypothetical protein
MQWVIEYWNKKKKTIECFSSEDGTWEDAPVDNVIFVYVRGKLSRPHGDPDRIYTMRLSGTDYYFLRVAEDGTVRFGGWSDNADTPAGGIGCYGAYCTWTPGIKVETTMITVGRPPDADESMIKKGVWVEEPWAERLGLTGRAKRTTKGCCDG